MKLLIVAVVSTAWRHTELELNVGITMSVKTMLGIGFGQHSRVGEVGEDTKVIVDWNKPLLTML